MCGCVGRVYGCFVRCRIVCPHIHTDQTPIIHGPWNTHPQRRDRLPHRSTYIFAKNSKCVNQKSDHHTHRPNQKSHARTHTHRGQFYVQKRTSIKDYCPGYFEVVAGGVVQVKMGVFLFVHASTHLSIPIRIHARMYACMRPHMPSAFQHNLKLTSHLR